MSPTQRPRQVTAAAWLIMVGSAFVVLLVFDRIADLRSVEMRESIQRFLAEPPGRDLGWTVDDVLSLVRLIAMVAAGCATAAAILGYHVLRRSRSARLALTVLAVPLFLSGLVTGGFISSIVAASAVMLWLQPARDWFRDSSERQPVFGGAPSSATSGTSGTRPAASAPPQQQPAGPPRLVWPPASAGDVRPGSVVWACVLTWLVSGLTALLMLASVVALAASPDLIFGELHRQNPQLARQGVSDDTITTATYAMAGVMVVWCLVAIGAAVLVWRRVGWARIVLVISATAAAACCLIGAALGAFVLVVPLAAAVATLALLLRTDASTWFSDRPGHFG